MKSYKDLDIYNISYELAVKIHRMSMRLPQYEMYEEGSQIRKSSKGITSCIVEGYGRRRYKADFIKFLVYAHASCDETILHLNFLNNTHDLNKNEMKSFLDSYNELGAKINKFIEYVEKEWK
ncbi:MAG: four helix bundle protein [Deltaproteobacteria bacterium]|nr:four helix bundle protein [Deltaproteobacteria bacterium]